jgi:hypothetical protein
MDYQKGEFCVHMGCWNVRSLRKGIKTLCEGSCPFSAYEFHNWLTERGYQINRPEKEEG